MIVSIQILRGIAALLVAVSHLPWFAYKQAIAPNFPDLTVCFFGVDLFFVVSGFVMVYATESGRGGAGAGAFLLRRGIRVLPLYWILTSLSIAITVYRFDPVNYTPHVWWSFLNSYLLIPYPAIGDMMDFYPALPQGWTLEYEAFFYLCFAACLWLCPRRKALVISVGFAALCVLGAIVTLPPPIFYYARTNTLEFVYGVAIARLYLVGFRLPRAVAVALIAGGAAAAIAFAPSSDAWDVLRGLGWGVPAAAIVGGAVLVRGWGRSWLTWPFEVLGDASYSLYLAHDFVYDGIRYLATGNVDAEAPISIRLFPVMILAALALAIMSYRFLERPLTRWLQHRLLARTPIVPVRLPAL